MTKKKEKHAAKNTEPDKENAAVSAATDSNAEEASTPSETNADAAESVAGTGNRQDADSAAAEAGEGFVWTEAPAEGDYVADIMRDEIRSGFFVDTGRKKLWNKQIELLMEIDRICRKHGIRYFSLIGTMLGAARHQGYVPWDDDLDVGMFRPDYERFRRIAAEEIKEPLYMQSAYTADREGILFITKLRDGRTTAIGQREQDQTGHQGIFIDIWPLDAFDDGTDETKRLYSAEAEILATIVDGQSILKRLQDHTTTLKPEIIFQLLQMQPLQRFAEFEGFCAAHWHESKNIGCFFYEGPYRTFPKAWFEKIIPMPFERITIPTPAMYDEILTHHYMSDWHQIVRFPVHATVFSTDVPYKDYIEQVTQK